MISTADGGKPIVNMTVARSLLCPALQTTVATMLRDNLGLVGERTCT